MANTDLYQALFGKEHITDGDVIAMSEHGRVDGISTGVGFKNVNTLSINEFLIDYDGTSNPVYLGSALPNTATSDSTWQIRKFTYDGDNITAIKFASGTAGFNKIWDSRVGYSYT